MATLSRGKGSAVRTPFLRAKANLRFLGSLGLIGELG